ncbi:MAG: DEAD/DEAH box helicase [Lentisphaeria bacterium]|jgi:superfamily II DNA or RNA helicase
MKMALPFDYPAQPPAWLDQWPAAADLTAQVPPGIRITASSIMKTDPPARLEWTEDRLSAFFGRHHAVWRHDPGNGWKSHCTCGYPKGCCPHAFLLAQLFRQVLATEGWRRPEPAPAPAPPPAMAEPMLPGLEEAPAEPAARQAPAAPALAEIAAPGDELFLAPTPAGPKLRDGSVKLEVEADLHTSPDAVLIRFYRTLGGRELLSIQSVRTLTSSAHDPRRPRNVKQYRGRDVQFLSWLHDTLKGPEHIPNRSQILKIDRPTFKAWLHRWADAHDRFIDRATQQFVSAGKGSGIGRATLKFRLTDLPDKMVELEAVVVTPAGKELRFRDILQQLAAGGDAFTEAGKLLELDYPVPREHLLEFFSRKTLRLTRAQALHYLPTLVHGRLDLLVQSKHVRQGRQKAPIAIEAKPDGASIVLTAKVGKVPLTDDGTGIFTVRHDGGRWLITSYTAPDLETVRELLDDLPATLQPDGSRVITGAEENVQKFVEFWHKLPTSVRSRYLPELHPLLGPATAELQPEFRLSDRTQFIDLQLAWRAGSLRLSDREVQNAIARGANVFRLSSGGWFRIDPDAVRELRGRFADFNLDAAGCGRATLPHARRALQAIATTTATAAPDCTDILHRLRDEPEPTPPTLPEHLAPVLRDYQKLGFQFLAERAAWKLGAILADDMGLGKTLQALAVLEAFFRNPPAAGEPRGALVVCPASVVAVWLEQAARFCPSLRCQAYRGTPERRAAILGENGWDVLVTNYSLLRNDIERLADHEFAFVILDEAQQIKNPEAQVTQAVFRLRTPRPLAITGTPLENRLLDLWSIMRFVIPGYLSDPESFLARYEGSGRTGELSRRVAPFILRRVKEAVARELPPRTEELLQVEFDDHQRRAYDARLALAQQIMKTQGPIELLAALTRLRQICCDPRLLPEAERLNLGIPLNTGSAKLDCLADLAEELVSEGHSLLVFSQFTEMLALIGERFREMKLPFVSITGETPIPERERIVRDFQESEAPTAVLLSLKAAGTGLTLTKADYVVIYDPWWNPAVERQAIDRTHRIGQTRPVIAYRLVAAGTVEEKMLLLQQEKAQLFAAVMADTEAAPGELPSRLTADDLARLLG